MPSVLDDAAAVAGFISLSVTLLAGCIKGFTILSDAWSFGQEASIVRCLLEVEQYRLWSWADTTGFLDDEDRLRFRSLDRTVIQNILEALASLLLDVQKLRKEYKLDLDVTNEEIKALNPQEPVFGKLKLRIRPKFYQQAANIFRSRNSPWKRLKWVVVDVDRARQLTQDINSMINHLERFLPQAQSEASIVDFEAMMRRLIVISDDVQDLKAIAQEERYRSQDGAVAASARWKQEGLVLGVLERTNSYSSTSSSTLEGSLSSLSLPLDIDRKPTPFRKVVRLDPGLLRTLGSTGTFSPRALARYDGTPVLVEWKLAGDSAIPKVRHRVERVTAFLNGLVHPSFHSLQCLGYFEDSVSDRYGYVFNLPRLLSSDSASDVETLSMPRMQTLKKRIRNQAVQPSLNERIYLAISLTETLLQLHTSGFLHKEIRPENVLFFYNPQESSLPSTDFAPAYLAGYVYARADNPLEATETPEAEFEADLYRHPFSIGSGKVSYRKTFDLFSLGCVLLELGAWKKLSTVLSQVAREEERNTNAPSQPKKKAVAPGSQQSSELKSILTAKQRILDPLNSQRYRSLLEASAGKTYANVAMACLHADSTAGCNSEEDSDTSDHTLNVEETNIAQLRTICV